MNIKDVKIPERIEKDLFITIGIGKYNFCDLCISETNRSIYASDGFEQFLLLIVPFSVDIPKGITEKHLKDCLVEKLQSKKKSIQAEYHVKLKVVQEQIDSLLCIDHKNES